MIELYYLKVFRLLDQAEGNGRKNLTANYLVERLKENHRDSNDINALLDRLNEYKRTIQPARHRVVAHSDLNTVAASETLGGHDNQIYKDFRNDLQKFCDEVGRAIGVGPCEFINIAPGDVRDLIRMLEKSSGTQ